MERLRGRPLLEERFFNLSSVLVDVQARLHDLDAEVLLRALDREGPPLSREVMSFDAYLGQMAGANRGQRAASRGCNAR